MQGGNIYTGKDLGLAGEMVAFDSRDSGSSSTSFHSENLCLSLIRNIDKGLKYSFKKLPK